MNFSRFTYYEALIRNIVDSGAKRLGKKRQAVYDEIEHQINKIYTKQRGGYWPVTDGDKVFISYMQQLKDALYTTTSDSTLIKLIYAAKDQAEDKINVVFFTQEFSVWPSFKSVYEACCEDERFAPKLVQIPFSHVNMDSSIDQMKPYVEVGLPVIAHDQYNLSEDSPDVAFYIKPYDGIPMQFYINAVDKVVRRCVYISYAFTDMPNDMYTRYGYALLLHYKAWKQIAYSQHHMDYICKYGYRNAENAFIIGHPRFDSSSGLNGYPEDETTVIYRNKIRGRRTLLWNTHHGITNEQASFGAFSQYKDNVFSYFHTHNDVVLLWRPHPLLFGALQSENIMTKNQIDEFKALLKNEDNIILDESKNYLNSFNLSDGMLSDGGPSMTFEFVATGKPIFYTVKQNGYIAPSVSIAECWYWVNKPDELNKFLDMFTSDDDPMKTERMEKAKKHIGPLDGHCGEHIRDYIADEIVKEEKEAASCVLKKSLITYRMRVWCILTICFIMVILVT